MKKLSVLVALMLIITVGGVYATWDYFQYVTGTANEGKTTITTIALTDKDVSGEDSSTAKGTISVTPSTLTISISDSDNDHVGEFHVSDDITGTFTPADNATQDVKDNGIPMRFELTCEGLQDFPIIIELINNDEPTKDFIITADAIETLLEQRWPVSLPTESDYDTFAATLVGKKITVTVYEYVDDGAPPEQGGGDSGDSGDDPFGGE